MAKYYVTHSCGHQTRVELFGKRTLREQRIESMEQHECADCRAAKCEMTGTVKQKAWALDIKTQYLAKYPNHRDVADKITDAKAWIDCRGNLLGLMERYT